MDKEKQLLTHAEMAIDFYQGDLKVSPLKAFKWALAAAKAGDARNMVNVAFAHSDGNLEIRNYKKSVMWLKKAARQNLGVAFYNLGLHYQKGQGVTRNEKKAFECFKRSADLNYGEGIVATGWCLDSGYGVKANLKRAVIYYKKAMSQDERLGYFNMGICYLYGKGVKRSIPLAIKCLSNKKLLDHGRARDLLAEIYNGSHGKSSKNKISIKRYPKKKNRNRVFFAVRSQYIAQAMGSPRFVDSYYKKECVWYEERVVLFKAHDFDEALELGAKEARSYASYEYINIYHQKVITEFTGNLDAFEVGEEAGEGEEIFSTNNIMKIQPNKRKLAERMFGNESENEQKSGRRKFRHY